MTELPDDSAELVWRDWRDQHGVTIQMPVQDPREFRGAFISGYQSGYKAGAADENQRVRNVGTMLTMIDGKLTEVVLVDDLRALLDAER